MSFSAKCADAGVDCPGEFRTESREELMEHVELHATRAHPEMDLNDEATQQKVASIVTEQ